MIQSSTVKGRVDERMTKSVVTLAPDESLENALQLVFQHGFRHVPVLSNDRLVGMLCDRDLLLATGASTSGVVPAWTEAQPLQGVEDIMRSGDCTLAPSDSLEDAALMMARCNMEALPVLHLGELVGIVSQTDLLRHYVEVCRTRGGRGDSLVRIQMSRPTPTARMDTTLMDAFERLDRRIGHLVAMHDDQLVGIVSERDLFQALAWERQADQRSQESGHLPPPRINLAAIMTHPVIVAREEESLSEAAERLTVHRIGALPVVRGDGVPSGMLSQRDILAHYAAVL